MAATRGLTVLVAILGLSGAAAQTAPLFAFGGIYEGGDPLHSQGEVALTPAANHSLGWNATRPHVLARELLFRAERADIEVIDRPRAYGFSGYSVPKGVTGLESLGLGGSPWMRASDAKRVEVFLELDLARVEVEGFQGSPARQAAYGQRVQLAEANCDWRPLSGLLQDTGLVSGRCQAQSIAGRGAAPLRVHRALVELRYTDPETGERRSLPLRLGPYAEPDPTVPGLERRGSRSLLLVPKHASAEVSLESPIHLNVSAPSLLVEGALRIPAGDGSYRWDETLLEDPETELRPTGGFLLSSPDGRRLALDGQTLNGPVARLAPGAAPPAQLALATAAVIVAMAALWRLAPALLTLFSRVQQPRALEHPRRRDIVEFLLSNPGARLSDLRQKLQMPRPAARYHLGVLVRLALVRREGRAAATRYWPQHSSPRASALAHASHDPVLARILDVLRREPGAPQRRLAEATGLTQPRVSRALRRLARLGLVDGQGSGRRRAYRPVDAAALETGSGLTP